MKNTLELLRMIGNAILHLLDKMNNKPETS